MSSNDSLETAEVEPCRWIAGIEIRTQEGSIVKLWEYEPEVLFKTLRDRVGRPPKAVAIFDDEQPVQVTGPLVIIEAFDEFDLESYRAVLGRLDTWEGRPVRIHTTELGDRICAIYRNVSRGSAPGRVFNVEETPREPLISREVVNKNEMGEDTAGKLTTLLSQLSVHEKQELMTKLQGEVHGSNPNVRGSHHIPPLHQSTQIQMMPDFGPKLSGSIPKLKLFSGVIPVPKDEISYEQWRHEVVCSQSTFPNAMIAQGIRRALRGQAADMVRYLGPTAGVDEMLSKLDVIFGRVATLDTMMQKFYQMVQNKNEGIPMFATRIEGTFNDIKQVYPGRFTEYEGEQHLKERLFHGMRKSIRDSIRFLYESRETSYRQVLIAARKAESESEETRHRVSQLEVVESEDKVSIGLHEMIAELATTTKHLGQSVKVIQENQDRLAQAHEQSAPTKKSKFKPYRSNPLYCDKCKKSDHKWTECPLLTGKSGNSNGGQQGPTVVTPK